MHPIYYGIYPALKSWEYHVTYFRCISYMLVYVTNKLKTKIVAGQHGVACGD